MSLIVRTYTFTDGTVAYGSQVDSEIANIVNIMNSLDQGNTTWTNVKVTTLLPQADVNCGGHRLTSVGTPTTSGDAAQYPITAAQITAGTITTAQISGGAGITKAQLSLSAGDITQVAYTTDVGVTTSSDAATQSQAITTTGGKVLIVGHQNLSTSGSTGTVWCYITRSDADTTTLAGSLAQCDVLTTAPNQSIDIVAVDTPAPGTYTYKLRVHLAGGASIHNGGSLTLIELKA